MSARFAGTQQKILSLFMNKHGTKHTEKYLWALEVLQEKLSILTCSLRSHFQSAKEWNCGIFRELIPAFRGFWRISEAYYVF